MDPNESLRELRVALSILMPRRDSLVRALGPDYKRDELDTLIDSAAALDVWLSKGGWLPDAWSVQTGGVGGAAPQPQFDPPCTCKHEPLVMDGHVVLTRWRWIRDPSCPSHGTEPDPFPGPKADTTVDSQ